MAEPIETDPVSRRTVLKGVAGVAGLATIPAIIAACSSSGTRRAERRAPARRPPAPPAASQPPRSVAAGSLSARQQPLRPRRAEGRWRRSTRRSRPRPASRSP